MYGMANITIVIATTLKWPSSSFTCESGSDQRQLDEKIELHFAI
jgi:hypothetical protein